MSLHSLWFDAPTLQSDYISADVLCLILHFTVACKGESNLSNVNAAFG